MFTLLPNSLQKQYKMRMQSIHRKEKQLLILLLIPIPIESILVINFDAYCHSRLLRANLPKKLSLSGWANET